LFVLNTLTSGTEKDAFLVRDENAARETAGYSEVGGGEGRERKGV